MLLGLLGEGARSRVWHARDSRRGDDVALKLVPLADAPACARLRNEAALAAAVSHPRLVRVLAAGEDRAAGVAWLSMELLPGTRAALSTARFDELLQALACMHQHGIVHGDVKPGNLMAAQDGSLKLGDYGLARRFGQGSGAAHGTPRYMAPEQARGAAPGAQSDVFAAGAILFELAAWRPAFNGSPFEIVQQVLAARPAWEALGDTPFEPVIRCAMAIDPRERYADAADFLRGFRAVCQRPW
jgi:serine/threonine-protein kinase